MDQPTSRERTRRTQPREYGMALQLEYAKQEDIEEKYRDLYTEQSGKWILTGVAGLKTAEDVTRVQRNLDTERDAHKKTKDRYRVLHFDGKSIVEMRDDELQKVIEAFDGYEELKTRAEGQVDDNKINGIVESRIKQKLAPIERERQQLSEKLEAETKRTKQYEAAEKQRKIADAVRQARIGAKADEGAEEDILLNAERMFEIDDAGKVVTKDGVGVTPGITPDLWFQEMAPKRKHWWPLSEGGGGRGSRTPGADGENPWSHDGWNMTKQGQILRSENGAAKAEQLAKAAGTKVGGLRPPAKK